MTNGGQTAANTNSKTSVTTWSENPRSGRCGLHFLTWACLIVAWAWASAISADELPPSLWTRKTGVDWPQFLGPTRDSKSPETGILTKWPTKGPKIVWTRRLGTGYSIGSVAYGRFYQFDRDQDTNKATLVCLNAETGEKLWDFAYTSIYQDIIGYDDGPRCAPLIEGNRVYIFGVEGMLYCLNATTGEEIWKLDTTKEFHVQQNFFGVGSCPIIEGDLLIAMIGGSPPDQKVPRGAIGRAKPNGSAIVAFDKLTGKIRYQIGDELASYSSLQTATIDGRRWCFAFCRGGLLGFEPASGKIDFHYPWRSDLHDSVNASTPVVVGKQVFVSETYGPGSSLLEVSPGKAKVVWQDADNPRTKKLQTHWNTPIYVDGFLYGSSGRHDYNAELRCIDWASGDVKWKQPRLSRTSLLYVDGHFVVLGEFGTLTLIKATPEKYDPVASVTLEATTAGPLAPGEKPPRLLKEPCWSAPILSHGLLYVRGNDLLVCMELIPEQEK
jgi:outer membrane protein assembly factor BamB